MSQPRLAALALLTLLVSSVCRAAPPPSTLKMLDAVRARYDLPALAVVVLQDGKTVEREAVGLRKSGDPTPVTMDDRFHLGSNTKAMTATLAAMLVEEGKLRWDTTIAEVFPELKEKMDAGYRAVTLEQLLTHRGGVPHEPPSDAWERAREQRGTVREQRYEFIGAVLAAPPAAPPGTQNIYSNQGYAIAGAMLERTLDEPWESLMESRLFGPLQMKSAGFGSPGAKGEVQEPWGHLGKDRRLEPVQSDNPPAIGPAGTVHCSLGDYARFVALHLDTEKAGGLLKPATLMRLHTPPPGEKYAFGWGAVERPWAGGTALTHSGSNTMWYVVAWLAPLRNFAVVVATNRGGEKAQAACDEVVGAMIQKHLD
jgi:CubicO group peptidase (beta-lactamase class C family)